MAVYNCFHSAHGQQSHPASVMSGWVDMLSGVGDAFDFLEAAPASTDTEPFGSNIARDEHGRGVEVAVRLLHPALVGTATAPTYVLMGRVNTGTIQTDWEKLPSRDGTIVCTLAVAAIDVATNITSSGVGLKAGNVSPTGNIHDKMGCNEFAIARASSYADSGATNEALSSIQVKVY
jgi:hypothetical protein